VSALQRLSTRENNSDGNRNKERVPIWNPLFYCMPPDLLESGKSLLDATESLNDLILAGSIAETDALR
jgi:hypothetical protein